MGEVAVTVGGRRYPITCDDGQEEHVATLAAYVDRKARALAAAVGEVGEARLLVMTSLVVADEMAELEGEFTPLVEALAARIESVAGRLEND